MLSKCLGTGNRHQPFFGCCPRGVRNWKQACPIFSELPAWSSELETGMSHFFGVARVEFRVEFPGSASTCPGQVRRNFRQWSTGQLEKFFAEVVGLDDNLDIFFAGKNSPWRGLGRLQAPMPGRFAETVGLDDSFEKKILGRIPTLARAWQGSDAGQARPGGYARQECGALGVGRTRIGRAIKRGWGEPSNEVGRASTKGPLGEPVLIGRARTHWASQHSLGEPVLIGRTTQPLSQWPTPAPVPARHCACSARLVKCLLGTASACSARSVPTYKCPLGTSTYKCPLGTSTYKCPLGTVPARHV